MQQQHTLNFRRAARAFGALLLPSLLVASGCSEEVGGDGWVPPRASVGGSGPGGSMLNAGGAEAGESTGGSASGKGGRGGSGGRGGTAGSTATAGTTDPGEAGTGGTVEPTSVCGNGVTEAPHEDCDDGNTITGDDCPANCRKACETCEKTFCRAARAGEAGVHGWSPDSPRGPNDLLGTCLEMTGVAQGGPAKDVPRKDLCRAMLSCVRRERCDQPQALNSSDFPYAVMSCFCEGDVTDLNFIEECSASAAKGKCYREMKEASEREFDAQVFGGIYTGGSPLGVANLLILGCDLRLCTEECYPERSSGTVAQIVEDISRDLNAAGESPLGNLLADSQRAALGSDFALLMNTTFAEEVIYTTVGGLNFTATPGRGADADGRVLESEVWHSLVGMDPLLNSWIQGTDAYLVEITLTGRQLLDVLGVNRASLQVSGLTYTWDASLPGPNRVVEVRKEGAPLEEQVSYSIAISPTFLPRVPKEADVVVSDKTLVHEFMAYLRSLPQPVERPPLNRITRLN